MPALNEALGIHGSFYFYTCITCGCALISYFALPDTTGKTLEEIEDMFRSKSSKKGEADLPCATAKDVALDSGSA